MRNLNSGTFEELAEATVWHLSNQREWRKLTDDRNLGWAPDPLSIQHLTDPDHRSRKTWRGERKIETKPFPPKDVSQQLECYRCGKKVISKGISGLSSEGASCSVGIAGLGLRGPIVVSCGERLPPYTIGPALLK